MYSEYDPETQQIVGKVLGHKYVYQYQRPPQQLYHYCTQRVNLNLSSQNTMLQLQLKALEKKYHKLLERTKNRTKNTSNELSELMSSIQKLQSLNSKLTSRIDTQSHDYQNLKNSKRDSIKSSQNYKSSHFITSPIKQFENYVIKRQQNNKQVEYPHIAAYKQQKQTAIMKKKVTKDKEIQVNIDFEQYQQKMEVINCKRKKYQLIIKQNMDKINEYQKKLEKMVF